MFVHNNNGSRLKGALKKAEESKRAVFLQALDRYLSRLVIVVLVLIVV